MIEIILKNLYEFFENKNSDFDKKNTCFNKLQNLLVLLDEVGNIIKEII